MIEWLLSLDRWLFVAVNSGLANPVGDLLWPAITDYDKILAVRIVLLALWLFLLVRGGRRGRTVALLLIPVLFCADQLASSVLKPLVGRLRPCHLVNGARVVEEVRLLVDCGPGKSFPSSHAVNNAAVALLFGWYYRRAWPYFCAWALLIMLSRVAVGLHYPSDVVGGALIGAAVAFFWIMLWELVRRRLLPAAPSEAASRAPEPSASPRGPL